MKTPRAPKDSPFRPGVSQRPTGPASLTTLTRKAQLGAPGPIAPEKGRVPLGLPRVPDRHGRRVFAPPPPYTLTSAPRPASAAVPPPPAPGPRWRQRSVTAPLLSFLRSAPCQEEALLHPKRQGPRPSAGGARVRGDPPRGRGLGGRRGGGEVARTASGRGGEPHSGSHRLLPAPASTFCTAQRGTCPSSLGPATDSTGEDAPRSWGAGSPKQPAP